MSATHPAFVGILFAASAIGLFACATPSRSTAQRTPAAEWAEVEKLFVEEHHSPPEDVDGLGTWRECLDRDQAYLPIRSTDGKLNPKCQPDTLYSWGPVEKLYALLSHSGSAEDWARVFKKAVFTHINPIATFGYGEVPIRMKIRSGVQYVLRPEVTGSVYDLCKSSQYDPANTVFVLPYTNTAMTGVEGGADFVDYVLCSLGPVLSWSSGMRDHTDEIANALNRVLTHPAIRDQIPYYHVDKTPGWVDSHLDGFDWSYDRLLRVMDQLHQIGEQQTGILRFKPGTPEPQQTADEHFRSAQQAYWNWFEAH